MDIVFTELDTPYVPHAVKFECVLPGQKINWYICLFHPVVYTCLLRFDILWEKGTPAEYTTALEELELKGGVEWHRALNVLGYSFLKVCKFWKAFHCFAASMRLLPSVYNSAVYQLCILIYKLISSKHGDCEVIYTRCEKYKY